MSSEVRKASGRARDLVGGQRESQRVSVRASENINDAEYRLNVGESGLEDVILEVLDSCVEEGEEAPPLIFQKMIEPDFTGAFIHNYSRRHSLVETVKGLGDSLEEGNTVPEFYVIENGRVTENRLPESQLEISRNPVNGEKRSRKVSREERAFDSSELEKLYEKLDRQDISVKFVYKRGSFYVVDAFNAKSVGEKPELEGLKISRGSIEGRSASRVEVPGADSTPFIASKGGFTSTASQKMREREIAAIVSAVEDEEEVERTAEFSESVTATRVSALESLSSLRRGPLGEIGFAGSCEEILKNNPSRIDGRDIDSRALVRALDIVEDVELLIIEELNEKVLLKVVELGIDEIAVPERDMEEFSRELKRVEKRFILDSLRQ